MTTPPYPRAPTSHPPSTVYSQCFIAPYRAKTRFITHPRILLNNHHHEVLLFLSTTSYIFLDCIPIRHNHPNKPNILRFKIPHTTHYTFLINQHHRVYLQSPSFSIIMSDTAAIPAAAPLDASATAPDNLTGGSRLHRPLHIHTPHRHQKKLLKMR